MTTRNSASDLTNPLEMVKKHVRLWNRSILMSEIGVRQDEHEIDTKNRTSTKSASEPTNPLEMVKNQFRLLNRSNLRSELGVRPKLRFWA